MSLLSLNNVSVAYDKNVILKDFNLNVEKGELLSLLGPSGCGKTTTLRLIAGFLQASGGQFIFDGKDYSQVPINKRHFGFVFQNYALFPHLSIFENVAFGLRQRKVDRKEIEKRVKHMLEVVSLSGFEKRFPAELSGGQRQRVAIARALVIKPDLLLFDEPLSNLDANLRVTMRVEIRRIQQELGITTVYVSHDQEECFSISDKVAILNKGVIEQLDQPKTIYKYPKTEFVARFIGFNNFIQCRQREEHETHLTFFTEQEKFEVQKNAGTTSTRALKLAIRPDNIVIEKCRTGSGGTPGHRDNTLTGQVKISTFLGRSYQYEVDTSLGTFQVNREMEMPFSTGDRVILIFPKEKLVLVD
ncbi:ABC transporter ATP-binding protein [Sporolactobacillus sp. THM7-7]|nr:ABC transporter ATP-binding protein [Sporolactobacillus sp. THM7-7]